MKRTFSPSWLPQFFLSEICASTKAADLPRLQALTGAGDQLSLHYDFKYQGSGGPFWMCSGRPG